MALPDDFRLIREIVAAGGSRYSKRRRDLCRAEALKRDAPGQYFGELALIDGEPRSARVEAIRFDLSGPRNGTQMNEEGRECA